MKNLSSDQKEFLSCVNKKYYLRKRKRDITKNENVFNRSEIDFTKQPMFFIEDQNTQRYDQFKYPIFDKLTQQQLTIFKTRRSFITKR